MNAYLPTYWFTWAFLIIAAALAFMAGHLPVSYVKDAFFTGLFAAFISAALSKVYIRTGPRFAPLIGASAGALWVVAMFFRLRWFGYADDFEMAQWTLGTDISVHAAGFAGAALMTALVPRQGMGKALGAGFLLAAAMTVIPYGTIRWIDYRVAGPVEVVMFVSAEVPAGEFPARRPGAVSVVLRPEEVRFLKERLLVVDGPGGDEVLDDQGHRFWPLWRRRLNYPGNPGGPVRTLMVILPPGLTVSDHWTLPVHQAPDGLALALLGAQKKVTPFGKPLSQSVRLELKLLVQKKGDATRYSAIEVQTFRLSPVGDLYAPITTQGLSAEFPATLPESVPGAKTEVKPRKPRPNFGPAPAQK